MWLQPFSHTSEIIISLPEQLKRIVRTLDTQGSTGWHLSWWNHSPFQMDSVTWASQNPPLPWQYQYPKLSVHFITETHTQSFCPGTFLPMAVQEESKTHVPLLLLFKRNTSIVVLRTGLQFFTFFYFFLGFFFNLTITQRENLNFFF